MLNLLLGVAGTGKTSELRRRIGESAAAGSKAILLVPEQLSFESEKTLYRQLGPKAAQSVEVLSFTRLCDAIFRRFGGIAGIQVNDTIKAVLMSIAVEQLQDTLKVYRKSCTNTAFLSQLLSMVGELKAAGLEPGRLEQFADGCRTAELADKTRELGALYTAYQALLEKSYIDPDDNLIRACKILESHSFFGEFDVFVDGFMTFMAGEFSMLRHIIRQARQVTFAFTADEVRDPQKGTGLFSPAKAAMKRLIRIARENGVPVASPVILRKPLRYEDDSLSHLSRCFYDPVYSPWTKRTDAVTVARAANSYSELEGVAARICKLVREEGLRYCRIAVIARGMDGYLQPLETVFAKYEIPYFVDKREDVESRPIVSGIINAVDAARSGYDSQYMLALAKSPLLGMKPEEAALLDNYCYIWGIRGQAWTSPFQNHPKGLREDWTEEDLEALRQLNALRERLAAPVIRMRRQMKDCTGKRFARSIWDWMEETGCAGHLLAYAQSLEPLDRKQAMDENSALWDAVVEILDIFGTVLEKVHLPSGRFCELLRLALSSYEIGKIPQTLDQVIVGTADRIRPVDIRAAFVIGVNEGVFPAQHPPGGLLSIKEREQLIDAGLELSASGIENAVREQFFAYFALTVPSRYLIVSYQSSDLLGRQKQPSSLIKRLQEIFPYLEEQPMSVRDMDRMVNRRLALEWMAENYNSESPLQSTLWHYFSGTETAGRIGKAAAGRRYHLADESMAARLFGSRIKLSPSRIEQYYNCPFAYFVSGGLGVRPRRKVEFSPLESGSVIHETLQVMVQRHGADLASIEEERIRGEIGEIIDGFLESRVRDKDKLPARFRYLFTRLVSTLTALMRRLGQELSQSRFQPVAFELSIESGGGAEPLRLVTPGGTEIWVEGVVDRVDVMKRGGKRYVRVVDYKSGAKTFKLSDVLYGLNLQMLVYLFTIVQTGKGELEGTVPAGILYMPVGGKTLSADRYATDEELRKETVRGYRMNGLILEDIQVISGMEEEMAGIFIPAKINKKGELDKLSSVADATQMGRLSRRVEKLISDMAQSLTQGRIPAVPVNGGGYDPCKWCDYKAVCGREDGMPARAIADIDKDTLYHMLEEQDEGND